MDCTRARAEAAKANAATSSRHEKEEATEGVALNPAGDYRSATGHASATSLMQCSAICVPH